MKNIFLDAYSKPDLDKLNGLLKNEQFVQHIVDNIKAAFCLKDEPIISRNGEFTSYCQIPNIGTFKINTDEVDFEFSLYDENSFFAEHCGFNPMRKGFDAINAIQRINPSQRVFSQQIGNVQLEIIEQLNSKLKKMGATVLKYDNEFSSRNTIHHVYMRFTNITEKTLPKFVKLFNALAFNNKVYTKLDSALAHTNAANEGAA